MLTGLLVKQFHGSCAPSLAIPERVLAQRESQNQTGRGHSSFSAAPRGDSPAGRAAGRRASVVSLKYDCHGCNELGSHLGESYGWLLRSGNAPTMMMLRQ